MKVSILKMSINSANIFMIHINAFLTLIAIFKRRPIDTCGGIAAPQMMEHSQHIHFSFLLYDMKC